MKKLLVVLLALGLVVAFSVPASAVDSIFGGYWRTRAYMQKDFNGTDDGATDLQQVDTRTRLYYTAKFSDDFKFVNKFEFNHTWGAGPSNGAGIGTDRTDQFRIKNSYADFNVGPVNAKVGLQGYTMSRGFLFSDDFAGAIVTYKGDGVSVPFIWMKNYEGGKGKDANDEDVDYYGVAPKISLDKLTVNPYVLWVTSDDPADEIDVYFLGVDADADLGAASVWFTGIYETGTEKVPGVETDLSAWLVALGGSANVGPASVHGQFFYATGDDDGTDNDENAFIGPAGQSYYWSEIMGLGIFDSQDSANSCDDNISDIMAVNLGATMKPMDKLAVTLDLWYAALAEDDANGETALGTEVDLKVAYNLVENLKLEVVGAYLFAGDATTGKAANDANPYEVGTRLSFSF